MFTIKNNNSEHNINTAKELLTSLGINADFSGYSDTNGVSVYFIDAEGRKIRVSNHSVTSINRIENEFLFQFDYKTLGIGGVVKFVSKYDANKKVADTLK